MTGIRRASLPQTVDLSQVPHLQPRPTTDVPLNSRQIVTFMTMWVGVLVVAGALEPPPANPNAAPVLAAVLMTSFLAGTGATAVLALTKSRFPTVVASVFTGGVAVAMTVACPVVGHHHLAAWWFAQLAVVTAPIVWSLRQLGPSRLRGWGSPSSM
jgi:hypothetical protein